MVTSKSEDFSGVKVTSFIHSKRGGAQPQKSPSGEKSFARKQKQKNKFCLHSEKKNGRVIMGFSRFMFTENQNQRIIYVNSAQSGNVISCKGEASQK